MSGEGTVYVVDDDIAVLESITILLNTAGFKTRGYTSSDTFLEECRQLGNACLLLDIMMPEMDGLELQHRLKARSINLPIIFMTGHGKVKMAVEAMKAGAFDFLEKPFNDVVLIDCIRAALEKQAEALRSQVEIERNAEAISQLTKREHQVFELLVDGNSNKSIARKLGISVRTTEVHRANIMRKLNAKSLSHLVKTALAVK